MTDSVLNPVLNFQLGESNYPVKAFSLAKTMKCLEIVSRLADEVELGKVFTESDNVAVMNVLVEKLPVLITQAPKVIGSLIALILTPNKKLLELEEKDQDIDNYLIKEGKKFIHDEEMSIEKAIDVISIGIQQMQLDALRKNLPKLTILFRPLQDQNTNQEEMPSIGTAS
jgi:hypothetical protein